MGPAIFVIAILGCGEGDTACRQVSLADGRYESFAECNAATPDALAASADLTYPVVVAQCRSAGSPASLTISPGDVKLPEASSPLLLKHADNSRPASRAKRGSSR